MSGVRRDGTTVLNIFNDRDYNRSVITIVAGVDSISKCRTSTSLIHSLFLLGDDSQLPLRGFRPRPSSTNPPERGEQNPLISFVTDLNTEKYEEEHFLLKITEV